MSDNHYGYQKDKGLRPLDGRGPVELEEVAVSTRSTGTVSKSKNKLKCAVCNKTFKAAVVAFNHFKGAHPDKNTSKDAWREYMQTLS